MKNKLLLAVTGSVIAGALLMGGTAFAQTTPAPQNGSWSGHAGHAPGVFGTVSAIDTSSDTLTITSKGFGANATATTYTVDATGATVTKNGSASTLGDVAVGDTVMVQGTVSGTNVTATSIRDGVMGGRGGSGMKFGSHGSSTPMSNIQGNGQPVVGGNVTAINGSTLTVVTAKGSVTYSVDASNATIDKGNATSSISNIAVGDNVVVQGAVSGTSVVASSVIDQGAPSNSGSGPAAMVKGGFRGFMGAIGGFFQHLFGFF